ncbi:class I SAM-dependent methyltransferase [Vagococcus sp. PNs007]|uniref:Class I SAM-dependent methyltransferase n=1 Tax=Vagococcus proximus TaxID=2991417 RepID=A0ABT5X0X2_9ENTE|nr:class I SAM-dependent methyltransferase [Vagococcus proximus]MDF0479647.1 class I SAM-dependent methyltransferase [Vagococcus proximus]
MTENNHYFTNQPSTPHDLSEWTFDLKGKRFRFTTDSGVFSKKTVDFGSRVLIDAFTEEDLPEGDILDVGCGYGPIGLSLASQSSRVVEMVDINERAVELAKLNAKHNGVANVEIHVSNIYESVEGEFAAVLSNPPIRAGKAVVHTILEGAYPLLVEGGTLTVVLQKKQGAPSAAKKMEEVFGNVKTLTKDKGYYILQSRK